MSSLEPTPGSPVREAVLVWAAVFAGLAVASALGHVVPPVGSLVGALAVAAFLYVPARVLERRGQDAFEAGWRFDRLGRDLLWALGTAAIILPLFALAFFSFTAWLSALPPGVRGLLAPYAAAARRAHLHIPLAWAFAGQVGGHAAVAFSEEFFYRGYLTMRFEERMTPVPAALVVALLFAVGHLLQPAPWRLAVFFPALWFAFLRSRTKTIVGAAIAHFLANVTLLVLETSM